MGKLVGILGGSFDPVHFGHLRLAVECLQRADLEKVIMIPLNSPPHRTALQASAQKRYHMLELATAGVANIEVSDIEIRRKGTTYTIDTLKNFRTELDQQSLCLILGMDAFQEFDTWKEWNKIPDYTHLLIAHRVGAPEEFNKDSVRTFFESAQAKDRQELYNSNSGKILMLDVPMLDISSSRIRELLQTEQSPRYLLPDNVLEYIYEQQIYQSKI